MSPDDKLPDADEDRLPLREPKEEPRVRKRSMVFHVSRAMTWLIGGVLALVIVVVGGFAWYTTTGDFQGRVGREIVSVLEDATGGRVEVHGVKFALWRLTIDVDGLVIHGLEGPGEAPYLSADKIEVRIGISSFFSRASGVGVKSHVRLKLLRVEHPQFHLIVDKDGKTNQPVPKHPSTSNEPVQDTLLDLRAKEADVVNGVALLNDKVIPFEMAANNLNAQVQYLKATDRYGIAIGVDDLRTKMGEEPEAQSKLHLEAELGRDAAVLKSLEFDSGKSSVLHVAGTLDHFAQPEWQVAANGSLELKQVSVLTATDGLTAGTVDLDIKGHSCAVSPAVGQAHPNFWQRNLPAKPEKPGTEPLPPDPECKAGYLVAGSAKLHGGGYNIPNVRLHDIDGGAQLRITPSELLLTAMSGYLPGGGSAAGELRIVNWLGEAPPAKSATTVAAVKTANTTAVSVGARPSAHAPTVPPVGTAHAYLVASVNAIPLRTIMEVTETTYGDLGFDTAVTGPVKVEWGGPVADVADSVLVDADLKFRPTGVARAGVLNNIPMTGEAVASYDGKREVVNIQHVILQTPQSSTEAEGVLGVNLGDPLTNLKADMTVRDLGEFDQLLHTLDFEANGKKGTAAVPVVLHGAAIFHGTVMGRAADLDWKGHVQGTGLEVKLGTELDTLIDSVVADAEYSYDGGLLVASSTIKRGSALLNLAGSMKPRKELSRRGVASYVWDQGAGVNASVQLANASVADCSKSRGSSRRFHDRDDRRECEGVRDVGRSEWEWSNFADKRGCVRRALRLGGRESVGAGAGLRGQPGGAVTAWSAHDRQWRIRPAYEACSRTYRR